MSEPSSGGFTFIEVMVALAIISGVMITLIASLNFHLGYMDSSAGAVTASMLAREKLEEIVAATAKDSESGDFGPGREGFKWSSTHIPSEFTDVKKLTVEVTWGDGRKVTLATYTAN